MMYDLEKDIISYSKLHSMLSQADTAEASSATTVMMIENRALTSNLSGDYGATLPIKTYSCGGRRNIRHSASEGYANSAEIQLKPLIVLADPVAPLCEMINDLVTMANLGKITIMDIMQMGQNSLEVKNKTTFGNCRVTELLFTDGLIAMVFYVQSIEREATELKPDGTNAGMKAGSANAVTGLMQEAVDSGGGE